MKKKITALVLSGVLCTGLFCGCGGEGGQQSGEGTGQTGAGQAGGETGTGENAGGVDLEYGEKTENNGK